MSAEQDIAACEGRLGAAMIAADDKALGTLFGDDLVWTHSSARVDGKESFIAGLKAGGTRYIEINRTGEKIRLLGDIAIVHAVAEMKASLKGEERKLRNRYLHVWAKRGGGWQLVARQSTAEPAA